MRTITRFVASRPAATRAAFRTVFYAPVAGQCFEIDIAHQGGQWVIHIPEIDDVTAAPTRGWSNLRHVNASQPAPASWIGYISVWVRGLTPHRVSGPAEQRHPGPVVLGAGHRGQSSKNTSTSMPAACRLGACRPRW